MADSFLPELLGIIQEQMRVLNANDTSLRNEIAFIRSDLNDLIGKLDKLEDRLETVNADNKTFSERFWALLVGVGSIIGAIIVSLIDKIGEYFFNKG